MKKQTISYVRVDFQKIFLTPPNTKREKITLMLMLVVTFILFFGPICFSPIPPIKAILLASMPAISISWGWMVLLRSWFRKLEFAKEEPCTNEIGTKPSV